MQEQGRDLIVALFRRRKVDQSALPEVDKYYDGERRDRAGLAWLLAFASVAIAALIFIGIFYAARWAYREITDDDSEVAVTQNEGDANAPSFDGGTQEESPEGSSNAENSEGNNSGNGGEGSDGEGDSENSSNENTSQGQTGDQEVPGGSGSTGNQNGSSNNVPATGDNPSDLPHTGPANLVGLFVGASTLAGLSHYTLNRRKKL